LFEKGKLRDFEYLRLKSVGKEVPWFIVDTNLFNPNLSLETLSPTLMSNRAHSYESIPKELIRGGGTFLLVNNYDQGN
jgi:hypothetical protein